MKTFGARSGMEKANPLSEGDIVVTFEGGYRRIVITSVLGGDNFEGVICRSRVEMEVGASIKLNQAQISYQSKGTV